MAARRRARRGPAIPLDRDRSRGAWSAAAADKARRFLPRAETGKRGSEREGFHPETEPTCRASSRPSHLGSPSANGAGSAAAAQDGFATKTVLAVELPRFRVRAKLLFSCV